MPRGGAREGAGRKPGGVGIATVETRQLLADLYARPDLKSPLTLLWEVANGCLLNEKGEPFVIPLELRVDAMAKAAQFSHSRPSPDIGDNSLKAVAFVMFLDDGETPQLEPPTTDVAFEELSEAAD